LFNPEAAPLAGLAVLVGHLYPLFHRFQGGKGVSTAAGVLLGLDPWLGLATLLTWVIIAVFFRYSSLASLIAALFAPFFAWYINLSVWAVFVVAIIAVLLFWRHRGNIARLLAGEESRIGHKKVSPPPDPSAASR
jgi:glycerol-3-phosphate acyltransferase PlsY